MVRGLKGDKRPESPTPKPKDSDTATILSEVNKKLDIIYNMEKKLDELTKAVDFYAEKYQRLSEAKECTENKIKALEQKNTYLEKCNKSLEIRVEELEEKENEKSIQIVGLEKKPGEDTQKLIGQLAKVLKTSIDKINHAMRVGVEKPDLKKPQPIIVNFLTKESRDAWIKCRKLKITNSMVYGNQNNSPIYINEKLTQYKRNLLWTTKNQLKGIYKYIWVQNGNILIKKSEEHKKIFTIRCDKDIERHININAEEAKS